MAKGKRVSKKVIFSIAMKKNHENRFMRPENFSLAYYLKSGF